MTNDGRRSYRERPTYRYPTYGNLRDPGKRVHPVSGLVVLTVLAGLVIAGLISFWTWSYQFGTETHVQITVQRLDDQATGSSGHQYLVFTRGTDSQPGETFKNTDAFWHGKFNSTDLQAQLQPGHTYDCDVYGHRNHFTSNYRDLLSCKLIR
jgi:hypothetical protein